MASSEMATDGTGIIHWDPWLEPYAEKLRERHRRYAGTRQWIIDNAGSLDKFGQAYNHFGLNRGERDGEPGVWYREWAPAAEALFLTGAFNDWDRAATPLTQREHGIWSVFLPDSKYGERLTHGSHVKVHVHSAIGPRDRVPAYIRRTEYDENTHDFCGQFWDPPTPYAWKHEPPKLESGLRIYEAHVGMAQAEERIGTYREFTDHVLPRITAAGYNAVQLMAIQEHPYYGARSATRSAASSRRRRASARRKTCRS